MAMTMATPIKATDKAGPLKLNGLHHLALLTGDMDGTVRFYTEVLGLPLVLTDAPPEGAVEKHYFFDVGQGGTLAFFTRRGSAPPEGYAKTGAMHHVCLTLDTMDDLAAARQRLMEHNVAIRDVDHGYCQSVYFNDPVNGILLELSVWRVEASPEHPHQQDDNPTPAARRLLAGK